MTTSDVRQQLIEAAMAKGTGDAGNIVLKLWRPLAFQLISIIGEGGFNALYARSIYLTHATFPWLILADVPCAADVRFTDLKIRLFMCFSGLNYGEGSAT
ncbi:MAG: hypothetical protein V4568_04210, partial [Pseudomonadota bacterium]